MRSLLACVVFVSSAIVAQVPLRYLVTSEVPTASVDGFSFIDPATGIATEVRPGPGGVLGSAATVAVDAQDPAGLYTSAGVSIGGAPALRLDMAGNTIRGRTGGALRIFGRLNRMHAANRVVLFTLGGVTPGLYRMAFFDPSPPLLAALADAMDIAVLQDKAYVNSYLRGAASTLLEVDLRTGATRRLGSAYPTIRSLGTLGGAALVAGLDNGDLMFVDRNSGALTPFAQPGKGSVLAIAGGDAGATTYFATERNEVYDVAQLARPVFAAQHTITDIDVGTVEQPAMLLFGRGCLGTNGRVPRHDHLGGPALGRTWTLQVSSALPGASAVLLLGVSRQRFGGYALPLALDFLNMPGCTLYSDVLEALPVTIGNAGMGVQLFNVPNDPGLKHGHVMGEWFIIDPGAGGLGVAASDGAEGIVQ